MLFQFLNTLWGGVLICALLALAGFMFIHWFFTTEERFSDTKRVLLYAVVWWLLIFLASFAMILTSASIFAVFALAGGFALGITARVRRLLNQPKQPLKQ